ENSGAGQYDRDQAKKAGADMSLHWLYFSAVVLLGLFGTEKEMLHYNESTLSDGIQKISADPFLHERSQLFKVMNCYQYCFFIDFFS
ncbi:MAG: hypothetical protein WBM35_03250, partial [Candidatus Electrothrix sp.]